MKNLKQIIQTSIGKMMLIMVLISGITMTSCSKDDSNDLTINDQSGSLEVNCIQFAVENETETAELHVRYKNADGLYMPSMITVECNGVEIPGQIEGDGKVYIVTVGKYIVRANGLMIPVEVKLIER